MDQVGNICRCHCHSTFLEDPPEWKCHCNCNTGNKDRNILDNILDIIQRIDNLEANYQFMLCDYRYVTDEIIKLRNHAKETEDHDERIDDLENIYCEQRLIKLESGYKGSYKHGSGHLPDDDDIENRLSALEHKIESQIDGLSNAIHEKYIRLELYKSDIEECRSRIDKFHDIINEDRITSSDVLCRITQLESHFNGDYQLVASKNRPHKCPVCDGRRTILEAHKILNCDSCEGKGIVWG